MPNLHIKMFVYSKIKKWKSIGHCLLLVYYLFTRHRTNLLKIDLLHLSLFINVRLKE